jgi:microtubule-associated protein, RP/EB family
MIRYNIEKMSTEAVIGLMDSAYFVSKNDLLKWINDTLQLEITYIEDLGSGSIYCQLIDAFYKQAVPMGKVNWHAKF